MKPSRSFRPSAPRALEGRVVLSTLAVRPVVLSAAEVAQSNASEVRFPLNTSDTIHAGQPVAEQLTTTYNVGTPQTESLLKVPDPSNNSVTIDRTIHLRNNGGTETVVDTETFSGGTIPFSGPDNTQTIKTTLPDGTIETETETSVTVGDRTVSSATIHEASGVETWTSVSIRRGATTTTTRTITEPVGTIEHQTTVTTDHGDLDSTSKTTTVSPGEVQVSTSATNVIRVQPPSS